LDFLPITAENLRRNVLEALGPQSEVDVDVFVYSFTSSFSHDERDGPAGPKSDRNERFLQLLNPVDVIMEADQERLGESGFRYCEIWKKTGVKASAEAHVQMIYGLFRVNMMRKNREEALGFSYDWIVRLRAGAHAFAAAAITAMPFTSASDICRRRRALRAENPPPLCIPHGPDHLPDLPQRSTRLPPLLE
jgi:hypothetical protein